MGNWNRRETLRVHNPAGAGSLVQIQPPQPMRGSTPEQELGPFPVMSRGLAKAVASWDLRSPEGTPFGQHFGTSILSSSVQFYEPTEAPHRLPQLPSGTRRPQQTGVWASRPDFIQLSILG